jgi:hypothetical protein
MWSRPIGCMPSLVKTRWEAWCRGLTMARIRSVRLVSAQARQADADSVAWRVPSAHARGGSPVRGRAHRVGIGARSHRLKGLNQRLVRDIWLLRLSALLARARGDDVAYRDLVNCYRAMAKSLGFDGHMRWPRRCREGGGIVVEFDGSADFRSPVADGLVGDRE